MINRLTSKALVCGLLAFAATVSAQDADPGSCSTRTLKGDYAFLIDGYVLRPSDGAPLPIRGIHMTRFDGRGNLTQMDHVIVNGAPVSPLEWTPVTGTYKVNADCTGTISLISQPNHFTNLKIVVGSNGKHIYAVVTTPFDGPGRSVSSTGVKVE